MNNVPKKLAASALALLLAYPAAAGAAEAVPAAAAAPAATRAASDASQSALAPVRPVAEALGAQIVWDAQKRTVTLARDSMSLVLTPGSAEAVLNGRMTAASAPVQLIGDRAYAPLDFLEFAFGEPIAWDADARTVRFGETDYAGRATSFIGKLFSGDRPNLGTMMSPSLRAALPDAALDSVSASYPAIYGTLVKRMAATVERNEVHTNARLVYETSAAPLQITVRFDRNGDVDDLDFSAYAPSDAYQTPEYDTGAWREQEVAVGEGEYALPGTLTIPDGEGPFPAVILVQGSGPHDRDSTIGGTKVFKDLAGGLASRGIAVLRYEKVTKEHTFKIAAQPQFTLKNETVDDVYRAAKLLRGRKEIDSSRIFVAGHSQGGFAVPMMLEGDADRMLAGAILLAAPSQSYVDAVVEQQRNVLARIERLGLPKEVAEAQKQTAELFELTAKLVKDPSYSVDRLPENFPIPPAYWWYEQRDYVPADSAVKQTAPMLVLQGENDWQVSMNQFQGWKDALKDRSGVEYRSYPGVNHLLTEYEGLSVGLEYGLPAHVAPAIVRDMADWILKR
jgi:hypothetical protein